MLLLLLVLLTRDAVIALLNNVAVFEEQALGLEGTEWVVEESVVTAVIPGHALQSASQIVIAVVPGHTEERLRGDVANAKEVGARLFASVLSQGRG